MINPELAAQIASLRAQANEQTVPGGLLAWWGALPLPDGDDDAPAIPYTTWQAVMGALRHAALAPGLVTPLPAVDAITMGMREDGPLPIAITSYTVSKPTPGFRARVMQAAANGTALPGALPVLGDILVEQDVFCVAAPMHAQWGQATPVFRSRVIRWLVDERFYFAAPMAPRPTRIEVDAGDGTGWRSVQFGDAFVTIHPTGDSVQFAVRCTWGTTTTRTARGTVAIGGPAAAPLPDDTWSVQGMNGNTGTAFVFRAPGHTDVVRPILVAEGFPGGYASDYLYEMWNQQGLLESLRARGYDVILLAYTNGADLIERNAAVVVACINKIAARTKHPIATGGVSMGGLCTRYALAWMEQRGLPHHTHLYFSVDAPHGGSTTSVSVQWFTEYFRDAMPMASDFASLMATPANQEFLVAYLDGDSVSVSPLRTALLQQFANLGGYPQQPRRVAVACGRGNGGASMAPGTPLLTWTDSPFVQASLFADPGDGQSGRVAQGECLFAPATPSASCDVTSDVSWEGAPGSVANYVAIAGAIAQSIACGQVQVLQPDTCVVPTISALDIAQDPFAPIPPAADGRSPFHDYICSATDQPHLVLTAATAEWLLAQLTSAPAPLPAS